MHLVFLVGPKNRANVPRHQAPDKGPRGAPQPDFRIGFVSRQMSWRAGSTITPQALNWCARQDSNLHCSPSEGAASLPFGLLARLVLRRMLVLSAWIEHAACRIPSGCSAN
jgi:hypothetical protein